MRKFSFLRLSFALASLSAGLLLSVGVSATSAQTWDEVKSPAQRIVAMDFGALDTLGQLGVGDRVVALPQTNTPEYLNVFNTQSYANTGGMKEPDVKLIAQLKPDLIITSGRQGASLPELLKIAPSVQWAAGGQDYLTAIQHDVRALAHLVDRQDAAEAALKAIDEKINAVRAQTLHSNQTAVVMIHNAGKIGPMNHSKHATLIHEVLGVKRADTSQAPAMQTRPALVDANAYLVQHQPDIIFVIDRSAAIGQGGLDVALWETDEIKSTPAYQNKKIIVLTPDLWYLSGFGLKSLSLQIDDVADALN